MNNELKYTLNAILLVLLFFVTIKFISFILEKDQTVNQQPANNIDWAMSELGKAHNDPKFDKGKQLFARDCKACHSINKTDAMRLADIETRITDKKLLYEWIRNSEEVIKSGNKYFNDLYTSYNKTAMSSFPNLTDEDINAILFYIKIQGALSILPIASAKLPYMPVNDMALSNRE